MGRPEVCAAALAASRLACQLGMETPWGGSAGCWRGLGVLVVGTVAKGRGLRVTTATELQDAGVLFRRTRNRIPVPVLEDDIPLDGDAARRLDGDGDWFKHLDRPRLGDRLVVVVGPTGVGGSSGPRSRARLWRIDRGGLTPTPVHKNR